MMKSLVPVKHQSKASILRALGEAGTLKKPVVLIDGNASKKAVGICYHYRGYLTVGLIHTHDCLRRNCHSFRKLTEEDVLNINRRK